MSLETKKVKIIVYINCLSDEILKEFSTIKELEHWIENEKPSNIEINADQVSINDCILLGWDELYNFI